MEESSYEEKGEFGLNQIFSTVMAIILISVMLIIGIFIFDTLSESILINDSGINATYSIINGISDTSSTLSLMMLVGTIVFLGLVIGIIVASFVFGGINSEEEDEEEEEEEEEEEIINKQHTSDDRVINKKW